MQKRDRFLWINNIGNFSYEENWTEKHVLLVVAFEERIWVQDAKRISYL